MRDVGHERVHRQAQPRQPGDGSQTPEFARGPLVAIGAAVGDGGRDDALRIGRHPAFPCFQKQEGDRSDHCDQPEQGHEQMQGQKRQHPAPEGRDAGDEGAEQQGPVERGGHGPTPRAYQARQGQPRRKPRGGRPCRQWLGRQQQSHEPQGGCQVDGHGRAVGPPRCRRLRCALESPGCNRNARGERAHEEKEQERIGQGAVFGRPVEEGHGGRVGQKRHGEGAQGTVARARREGRARGAVPHAGYLIARIHDVLLLPWPQPNAPSVGAATEYLTAAADLPNGLDSSTVETGEPWRKCPVVNSTTSALTGLYLKSAMPLPQRGDSAEPAWRL